MSGRSLTPFDCGLTQSHLSDKLLECRQPSQPVILYTSVSAVVSNHGVPFVPVQPAR